MNIKEFNILYPTREDKERALADMPDDEIDELIKQCDNIYGKIFYSSFKSEKMASKGLLN